MTTSSFRRIALAIASATALVACATGDDYAEQNFVVLERGAQIPFSSMVNEYRRVDNDTLLFRTGATQWYRAELAQQCATHLFGPEAIAFDTQGVSAINRGSSVFIGGHRCRIEALDRIAPPDQTRAEASPTGS